MDAETGGSVRGGADGTFSVTGAAWTGTVIAFGRKLESTRIVHSIDLN